MSSVLRGLNSVREQAAQLQRLAKDLLPPCEEADEVSKDGISLLQAKYATLMRYNLNLTRLSLARIHGKSITSIAKKLVEDSVVLSKLRPIERKLQHHIDLLLKGVQKQSDDSTAHLRPNPSDIVIDEDEEDDQIHDNNIKKHKIESDNENENDIYKPPKLTEVVYDANEERKRERKLKEKERFKQRALRTETIREMVAQVKGLPDEIGVDGFSGPLKSSKHLSQVHREDANRNKYEEKNFARLSLSSKDKKRRRDMIRSVENDELNDYKGLSSMADRVIGHKSKKQRANPSRHRNNDDNDDVDDETKLLKLDQILDD